MEFNIFTRAHTHIGMGGGVWVAGNGTHNCVTWLLFYCLSKKIQELKSFINLSRSAIVKSLEQLFLLGALTDECKLSDPVGCQMSRLPLDPIYSKALIVANEFKCLEEMLITVAMLSVESIFYAPRDKLDEVCCVCMRYLYTCFLYLPRLEQFCL